MKITRLDVLACLTEHSDFEVAATVLADGQEYQVLYTVVNVKHNALTGSDLMIQIGRALVAEGRRTK